MRTWTLTDAKSRIAEIFRSCVQEPQIVYDQNKPVGVVVDVKLFADLMRLRTRPYRPTIAELFEKLDEIHKFEEVEIEAPIRHDRPNELIESADEISL